jgi:hypothetical protein
MRKVYDIDAVAGDHEPVEIKLRGITYVLGETAREFVSLTSFFQALGKQGYTEIEPTDHVQGILSALAPEIPQDLTGAEVFALSVPVSEVVKRFNALTFSAPDPAVIPVAADGGSVPELLPAV